jgi:hypothetical protein
MCTLEKANSTLELNIEKIFTPVTFALNNPFELQPAFSEISHWRKSI